MAEISDYNIVAASNNSAPPDGAPENTTNPSDVNNIMREMMAVLARWFEDTNGSVISAGTDTITLAAKQTISVYAQGQVFMFEAGGTNTGAATLDVDSVGAKAIVKNYNAALVAGDIVAGQIVMVAYEAGGDNFQMLSSPATSLATTFTVADESTDTTCSPVFVTAATGDLAPKSGTNLTFNSNTGELGATLLGGTLTTAAQTNITTVGTLTTLTVDNITINTNSITSAGASSMTITPLAGQSLILDGALDIDGAVMGYTGVFTVTGSQVIDGITIDAATIVGTTAASLEITPTAGQSLILDGAFDLDGAVLGYTGVLTVTGSVVVDTVTINGNGISTSAAAAFTIDALAGQAVTVEGVSFDGGLITNATSINGVAAATAQYTTAEETNLANQSGTNTGDNTTAVDFTVADESSDTTCFVVFVTAATGDLAPKSGTNLIFNSSTGDLTPTLIAGVAPATAQYTTAEETIVADAVIQADFNANTILAATVDDTPVTLTIPVQTLVGRITAGNIDALTPTEVRTLINVANGATAVDLASPGTIGGTTPGLVNASAVNFGDEDFNAYDEGTFTPTLTTSGTDFDSVTYDAVRAGRYIQIGNLMYVVLTMKTDAVTIGSANGATEIDGLPASAKIGITLQPLTIGVCANWVVNPVSCNMKQNSATIALLNRDASGGSTSNNVPADVATGTNDNETSIAGSYEIV